MTNLFHNFKKIEIKNSEFISSCRGLAALLVLLAHIEQVFLAPTWMGLYPYSRLVSQAAVMIFFVLSGLLIGKSITRQTAQSRYSFPSYARDRAWRILPPLFLAYSVMLALYCLAPYVFESGSHSYLNLGGYSVNSEYLLTFREIAASALFLNGFLYENPLINGPLWSLPYEVWLYVIAGLLVGGFASRWLIALSLLFFVTLSILNKTFAAYSIVWFSGFFLCLAHNNGLIKASHRKFLLIAGFALFALALVLGAMYVNDFLKVSTPAAANYRYVILFNVAVGLAFCFLLAGCMDSVTPNFGRFHKTADYSYTLYIIHFPILLFIFGAVQSKIQGSFGLIALVSLISFVALVFAASRLAVFFESKSKIISLFFAVRNVKT